DAARCVVDRADECTVLFFERTDPEILGFIAIADGDFDRHVVDTGARRPRWCKKVRERLARLVECSLHVGVALWNSHDFIPLGAIDCSVRAERGRQRQGEKSGGKTTY